MTCKKKRQDDEFVDLNSVGLGFRFSWWFFSSRISSWQLADLWVLRFGMIPVLYVSRCSYFLSTWFSDNLSGKKKERRKELRNSKLHRSETSGP